MDSGKFTRIFETPCITSKAYQAQRKDLVLTGCAKRHVYRDPPRASIVIFQASFCVEIRTCFGGRCKE